MDWLISKFEDWVLPVRLYFGHKYMYDELRKVVKIWPNRLVKGPIHESEHEALVYIANHTNIPVPKVRRIYHRKDGLFVERDFVEGEPLDTIWNDLLDKQKRQYIEEVWSQLRELRTHAPPPSLGGVVAASISGGPVKDGIFSTEPIGPYRSFEEFHDRLGKNPNELALPPGWDTSDNFRKALLTNADVSPRNIVVCQKGEPSSICMIDWECGGWWPVYWERVKWHFCDFPPGEMEGWVEMMDEVSDMSYPE